MYWKQFGSHLFSWLRSFKSNPLADARPWITLRAIDFLDRHLDNQMSVFEYGGGGSTLFFLTRCKKVVTVEHNPEWFNKIEVLARTHAHWEGLLIAPEEAKDYNPERFDDPMAYLSADKEFQGKEFRSYASRIDHFQDESFDVVLVDGRARPSCISHCIPKIKAGGWLVVDNSDREYYLAKNRAMLASRFTKVFDGSGPTPYSTWFTRTGVWEKVKQ